MIILEIVVGFAVGVLTGLLGWLFKFTKSCKYSLEFKALYIIFVAIALTVGAQLAHYKGAKYIAALTCGYINKRFFWGEDKPVKQLEISWLVIK